MSTRPSDFEEGQLMEAHAVFKSLNQEQRRSALSHMLVLREGATAFVPRFGRGPARVLRLVIPDDRRAENGGAR